MTDTTTPTRRALDYEARYRKLRRTVLWGGAIVAVLVLLIVTSGALWVVDQTSKTNHLAEDTQQIGRDNRASLKILKDATTPGSKLYKRGQKTTAAAIGQLLDHQAAEHLVILNQERAAMGLPPLTAMPAPPGSSPPPG